MALGDVCEHGQLARSCDRCEAQREIAELRKRAEAAEADAGRLRRGLEILRDEFRVLLEQHRLGISVHEWDAEDEKQDESDFTDGIEERGNTGIAALAGPAPAGEWIVHLAPDAGGAWRPTPHVVVSADTPIVDEVAIEFDGGRQILTGSASQAHALAVALLSAARGGKQP
jgi:hypothetical protein